MVVFAWLGIGYIFGMRLFSKIVKNITQKLPMNGEFSSKDFIR